MTRRGIPIFSWTAVVLLAAATTALATPTPNSATIETRTFNDCPLSTVTTTNNYPSLVSITDAMFPECVGFANLHSWSFSEDGGATQAVFNNNSNFHFGADVVISGAGEGEGGLRISPWYGKFVDGRIMANATTGEIACFGGTLPFYSFTVNHGINYIKGTTIRMEATYLARDLFSTDPASIQYRVIYNGTTYDSPVLPFGQQNPNECNPNGLWGMLNDGRVGGYVQVRANTGESLTATWSNVTFEVLPATGTPVANAATIETRTFNDCPLSTVSTTNNYPSSIAITDAMFPECVGFANLHSWSFSEDGGTTQAVFNNNSNFHFGADLVISGAGEGEAGLRISPWYGKFVDGRLMANATTGEIACFGGTLPFYSFTVNHGIHYIKGTTIHLEATYQAHELVSTDPATIQYRVIYNGNTYDSPVLLFGQQNPNECTPNGLWGMLNDGRVGGYFQARANTGESLTATWGNITYSSCFAAVSLTFAPHQLNLASGGKYVTGYLEPGAPYGPGDIDVASVRLNGVPVAPGAPTTIGDFDNDGTPDLALKFDRSAVVGTVSPGQNVTVTATGTIGIDCFTATDVIKVKDAPVAPPVAGSTVMPGQVVDARWTRGTDFPTVDVVSSFDDGMTWNVEARGIRNTGRYSWIVPNVSTARARLAIIVIASQDETGIVAAAEVASSGTFAIGTTTGVGDGMRVLALRGIAPNPTRGEFTVSFNLPGGSPASVAVYDVSGRQVSAREVGGFGSGQHVVTFGRKEHLPIGVYVVRLTQGGRSLAARAIVIR